MAEFTIIGLILTGILLKAVLSRAEREAAPEKVLIDSLLRNYSPNARPVSSHNHTVHVYVGFAYVRIMGVDENEQSMTSMGTVRVEWTDPFLTWNSSDYSDIDSIYLPIDRIWTPDIVNLNSVESMLVPIKTDVLLLKLYHNGSVTWMPFGIFHSYCDLDISHFPFDKQSCYILIGSSRSDSEHIRISLRNSPRSSFHDSAEEILSNTQWEVLGESSTEFTSPNNIKTVAVFTAKIRRRSRYFVMNILFPSFVLTILNIFVFLVPHDFSDKVGVSTTVVLAYIIFLIQVTDSTPSNSDQIPFVTVILLVMMSLSAVDVILSIFILRGINRVKTRPPPIWLQRLTRTLRRKDRLNAVTPSPNTESETAAVTPADWKKNSQREMSKQEIWQKQWERVGQTIEKGSAIIQALIVLSLYATFPYIYILET